MYLQQHPIVSTAESSLIHTSRTVDTSHYVTSLSPSFSDQVGTAAAGAALDFFGALITHVDPGAAPGVQATTAGIKANLAADVAARSTHTSWVQSSSQLPYDVIRYASTTPFAPNPYSY